jgi:hypothetical protein
MVVLSMRSRILRPLLGILGLSALCGCAGTQDRLLPQSTTLQNAGFVTYDSVLEAYESVEPGVTPAAQLPSLGFNLATAPNTEVLSYLGVIERFMPREAIKLETLAPAVRTCILAQHYCTGYVFKPSRRVDQRQGNVALDALSFRRTTITTGWSAEVILLVQDGMVTYKLFSGQPRQDATNLRVQPLGPLQDSGGLVSGAAGGIASSVAVP